MMTRAKRATAAAAAGGILLTAVAAAAAPATAGTPAPVDPTAPAHVSFDELAGQAGFWSAYPLREEYAGIGMHFFGPTENDGGAVMDAVEGNWPVPARSGTQFLGFANSEIANGGIASPPETIRFDRRQRVVRLFVSQQPLGGPEQATFTLVGRRAGKVVDTAVATTTTGAWTRLRVTSDRGIIKVVLQAADPDGTWAADDLVAKPRLAP